MGLVVLNDNELKRILRNLQPNIDITACSIATHLPLPQQYCGSPNIAVANAALHKCIAERGLNSVSSQASRWVERAAQVT
jgi:hypothetical protein